MHQIFFYTITIQLLYNNLLLLFHQHHQPAPSITTIDHHHPSEEYNLTIFDYQLILSYSMIPSAPCISTIRLTHPSREPPPHNSYCHPSRNATVSYSYTITLFSSLYSQNFERFHCNNIFPYHHTILLRSYLIIILLLHAYGYFIIS